PFPTSVLSSTPDPCLTAFAQLGLYRLNATHSIVSLFDRTYQHFVAEAIRCPPLCHIADDSACGGQIVYCGTAIPRVNSLCEHVLTGPAELASIPGTTDGAGPANLPVSVIPNLDEDPRFCHIRDKNRRFYAGVPIRSPTGVNIGVYCVVDNKPRPDGLTKDQVQFVRDISKTVMDYLEAKRSSEWYRRGERMVRGLGSFVEGQATLSNWSDNPNKSFFRDIPGVREGVLNKRLQEATAGLSPGSGAASPGIGGGGGIWAGEGRKGAGLQRERSTTEREASRLTSAAQLQADVERVFSKASNVIREAVEVEGVVFLDASVRAFGGMIGKELSEPPILTRVPSSQSSSDESSLNATVGNGNGDHSTCKVLGFSTSSNSSINNDSLPAHHAAIPEKLLRRLLQRYHHGHIFNFETDGTILDFPSPDIDEPSPASPWPPRRAYFGDSEDLPKHKDVPQRVRKRRDIASTLQKMFPGAKSVAFIPLFDGQKNRWFAGGFVWTKTPTRIFTVENELSYLRVFALTAMAEVARLHTRSADKTKTDILGSISHELRSPLHGIVGAVELLRSTLLDRKQENTLRTIETSGRTLLDTIDHASLDYSRISNQIRAKTERRGSTFPRTQVRNISPATHVPNCPVFNVHLDRLAEEVVESVLAGWSYRNRSDVHFAAWSNLVHGSPSPGTFDATKRRQKQGHLSKSTKPVQILLDIEPGDWSFRTHPGAFRRTVMNLLGNSLKFTKSGFIRLKLFQESDAGCEGDGTTRTAVLSVSDSGKGIGQEYLKHQLFTPFSQEDPFAPGTGLGLSLVRQMAITLGGNIDVASRSGHGTTVTVSVPLPRSQGADEEEPIFKQNITELAGRRVLLQGLDNSVFVREGFRRADRKQKSQLRLVEEMCRHWLHMEVVTEATWTPEQRVDFVICIHGHTPDDKLIRQTHLVDCPHVFIRQDPSVLNHRCSTGENACYLMPPVGPRKLADALVASRLRFQETIHTDDTDGDTCPGESLLSPPLVAPDTDPFSPVMLGRPDVPLPSAPVPGPTPLAPVVADKGVVATSDDGPSILIVDDNRVNIKILTGFMAKLHRPHSAALNGLQAVEMYTKAPTDYGCILTDINMPVMDGLESTRRIREFERENKLDPVTVITLTGLSGQGIQEDAFVSGVDLFLTKPLTLQGLTQALEATGVMQVGKAS
ncbi:hypothetical protein B0T16DRAFT_513907, partial [Cercophora newfieldiana]